MSLDAKSVTLFFASKSVSVVFYPGTPRTELLAGFAEVLGVPTTSPLRFRNEAGDVVVVSSAMPVSFDLLLGGIDAEKPFGSR
jgi:hypothetical protein